MIIQALPTADRAMLRHQASAFREALGNLKQGLTTISEHAMVGDQALDKLDVVIESMNDLELDLAELLAEPGPDPAATAELYVEVRPGNATPRHGVPHFVRLEGFLAANDIDTGEDADKIRAQVLDGGEVVIELGVKSFAVLRPLTAADLAGPFINVYQVQRVEGGPEEGGWYYDQSTPYSFHPFSEENLVLMAAVAEEVNKDLPPLHSVSMPVHLDVRVETELPRPDPAERPTYS